jgi:rhamnosyltransferase
MHYASFMLAKRFDVVVRCFNEMPHASRTFAALKEIEGARLVVFDSGSTDGSLQEAERVGAAIVRLEPGQYVPGRVLNEAMRRTEGEVVAFVNADAVPVSPDGVKRLVQACEQGAAAAFGRQVARRGARSSTRFDYARTFPDDPSGNGWRHFFSMAASAIRRDVWQALPFDEVLRYSEDVDWTFRVRALGRQVRYVPEAVFEHSHDYDTGALWRRMAGEGKADSSIYRLGEPDVLLGFALPFGAQLLRDASSGITSPTEAWRRMMAQAARYRGRTDGTRSPWRGNAAVRHAPAAYHTLMREESAEQMVRATVESAAEVVWAMCEPRPLALVLLGGFAYGEGAVEVRQDRPVIHNDLDLVMVVASQREARAARAQCERASRSATIASGASVDVWAVSRGELEQPRGKLLWVDAAIRGARVLRGDESILAPLGKLDARSVRRGELGRLLANRATGLALSRLQFEMRAEEGARAARHVAKAWMAMGDALLIAADQYPGTGQERLATLERLSQVGAPHVGDIARGYAAAMQFRRAPHGQSLSPAALEQACSALWRVHAILESHRLGEDPARRPLDYAGAPRRRMPELDDVPLAGRWLSGVRAARQGAVGWRLALWHPRESLARMATLLAYEPDPAEARGQAARLFGLEDASAQRMERAVRHLRELGA